MRLRRYRVGDCWRRWLLFYRRPGVTDASTTAACIISFGKLMARVQQSSDPNARELAERVAQAIQHPDRRVGAALMPKGRGGVPHWLAMQRDARASSYRDLALADYGTEHLTRKQANALARKVKRRM